MAYRLLDPDEPPAFMELRSAAQSPFVITVDHASRRIPRKLRELGLPQAELDRHIAWDIGALEVARRVAEELDAVLVATNYSRLVIDCNRDPAVSSSIPTIGEYTEVPGNRGLSEEEIGARRRELFQPYHEHIHSLLDRRAAGGRRTILVAQHSMTDVFKAQRRAMHAAVLYNRDPRFARLTRDALRSEAGLIVGDNEPYFVSDATDYTIPRHAEARGLPHVEIEVRQDLIRSPEGQARWAARIAAALRQAEQSFNGASSESTTEP